MVLVVVGFFVVFVRGVGFCLLVVGLVMGVFVFLGFVVWSDLGLWCVLYWVFFGLLVCVVVGLLGWLCLVVWWFVWLRLCFLGSLVSVLYVWVCEVLFWVFFGFLWWVECVLVLVCLGLFFGGAFGLWFVNLSLFELFIFL